MDVRKRAKLPKPVGRQYFTALQRTKREKKKPRTEGKGGRGKRGTK